MPDFTISVALPPKGDLAFDRSARQKMPVLAVNAVHDLPPKDEITDPVHGFIRVTGAPAAVTARRLAERITQAWIEYPLIGVERFAQVRSKRLWRGVLDALTLKQKAELLRDRKTTMTWDQFRDAFKREDTGETVRQELVARALER